MLIEVTTKTLGTQCAEKYIKLGTKKVKKIVLNSSF
jgi:hypothetical protein